VTTSSQETRGFSSLLAERPVYGVVLLALLTDSLVSGIAGIFFHTLWIVSIILFALAFAVLLGLGLGRVTAIIRPNRR
jgi:hypothetical protein